MVMVISRFDPLSTSTFTIYVIYVDSSFIVIAKRAVSSRSASLRSTLLRLPNGRWFMKGIASFAQQSVYRSSWDPSL